MALGWQDARGLLAVSQFLLNQFFLEEIRALFSKAHGPFRSFKTEARQQWVPVEKPPLGNGLWNGKVGGKEDHLFP